METKEQYEKRKAKQREKYANDPEYRAKRQAQATAWQAAHPEQRKANLKRYRSGAGHTAYLQYISHHLKEKRKNDPAWAAKRNAAAKAYRERKKQENEQQ